MNTTDFLDIAAAICPDRSMMVHQGRRISFAQAQERVNRLANALAERGLGRGDVVAVLQVNCPEYIEAYFATAKLGGVFLPLNFRSKAEELAGLIDRAGAKFLLLGRRYLEAFGSVWPGQVEAERTICLDDADTGKPYYEDLLARASAEEPPSGADDDVTIVLYTAGTTGRPKAVPLGHQAFVSYVLDNIPPADPDVEEKNILTVPLYHVAGIQAMMAAVFGGRTLVLMPQFEVGEWLATVEREQVNRAMLVPTMLKWVVDAPDFDRYDLSSLKVITYGAAPMPLKVIEKAIDKLPWVSFINAFGQTETASTIAFLGPEDHDLSGPPEVREKKLARLKSSIGRPLADVEVAILDADDRPLPPDHEGEIAARGPRVMSGYWDETDKNDQVFTADGWLKTGDRGWMDDEGYIYLAGRGDDIIIRGGENISPTEVENVINSHPDVDESAVIGLADQEWGQQLAAVVALKQGHTADEAAIQEHCRTRLSGFKRPSQVFFVEDLPRNAMGKVLKKELRAKYDSGPGPVSD